MRWTRLQADAEITVLSLENGDVRVQRAYEGRVGLPGFHANRLNVSLALSQLRTNDSGTFVCHVTLGDTYEQDMVTLEVTGEINKNNNNHKPMESGNKMDFICYESVNDLKTQSFASLLDKVSS